jgi:ribosome-binding factor A
MSHHQDQVESTLKRTIAKVLGHQLADPRIKGMVSVTGISVSPDQKRATVLVSVMPDKYEARSIAGLNAASGHIQSKARKMIRMRTMPALVFKLDASLKKQAQVFQAINDAMAREEPEKDNEELES